MQGELSELAAIARMKRREMAHRARGIWDQSLLKVSVLTSAGLLLWVSLFLLFRRGFVFMALPEYADFRPWILPVIFPVFFLSLGTMMAVSGGVVAHASLFHSPETTFLRSLPIRTTSLFGLKFLEVAVVSSWAFLFLGVPLAVAFGTTQPGLPWFFTPTTVLFYAFFLWIPASLGTLGAMLLNRFWPSRFRLSGSTFLIAGVFAAGWWVWGFFRVQAGTVQVAEHYLYAVLDRFSFGYNPLYPSYWIGIGMLGFSKGDAATGWFFLLQVVSNALFLGMLCYLFARSQLDNAFARALSRSGAGAARLRMALFHMVRPFFLLFQGFQRTLLEKDLRVFLRDSTQWSQFIIFFGLLGVYFFNLRKLPYNVEEPYWQSLVSFLNLAATALTLCTFTSRFVFPMVSLEGKRFWILGLLPIARSEILKGKFLFSFFGSMGVSGLLIVISDIEIGVPSWLFWIHLYIVVLVSLGLSGLSVGLGTLYPNFREDNPSKIVSGFGGTLNLLLGLVFITAVIALQALPTHFWYAQGTLTQKSYQAWITVTLTAATALALAVCCIPLWRARVSFEKMEI